MDTKERDKYQKMLAELNRSLADNNWDVSLFFQRVRLKLEAIKAIVQKILVSETEKEHRKDEDDATERLPAAGSQTVFLSLYQADGNNMTKWASVLASLQKLSIGRPVYAEEAAARAAIRSKKDPRCEAYVAVRVRESDIVPSLSGVAQRDKQGNDLLTLNEGAFRPENVLYFCHISGRYQYVKNRLEIEPETSKWADK